MQFLKPTLKQYAEHTAVIEQCDFSVNTGIISPTGSGKTGIMVRLIDKFLKKDLKNNVLVVCPTNILTDQIADAFKLFTFFNVIRLSPTNKEYLLDRTKALQLNVYVTTGHYAAICFKKDLFKKDFFNLIIFDEVHKAYTPSSPYLELLKFNPHARLIGLSATLEGRIKKKVVSNLNLELIIIGSSPFQWRKEVSFKKLTWSKDKLLRRKILDDYLIKKYSFFCSTNFNLTLTDYLMDQINVFLRIGAKIKSKNHNYLPSTIGLFYKLFNILFARYLYFFEDYEVYLEFVTKKASSPEKLCPALKILIPDKNEKFDQILTLIKNKATNSAIIIFFENYHTLTQMALFLNQAGYLNQIAMLGGKSKLTEKTRKKTLEDIKKDHKNIILCTSVAEEGIDVGSADTVVFFKPISNDIRFNQRKGRTGRHDHGNVIIYYYSETYEESIVKKKNLAP